MVNVGVAVATSAWFLASASEQDALATVRLISDAAGARLALEKTQAATPEILSAWRKWYGEALDSVRRLKPGPASAAVDAAVVVARAALGPG
jgi:hypothetical protein